MTSRPAPQPLLSLDVADAAEFTRVRAEILPARRRELSQREFERAEYHGFRALGDGVPFLCRREWIPAQPVLMPPPSAGGDSRAVIVEYDPALQEQRKPEWTDEVLRAAQCILPRLMGSSARVSSYAEAIALSRPLSGGSLFNGTCYRLLAQHLVQGEGEKAGQRARLKLTFGVCGYFDYLNTTEVLAHEAAAGDGREIRAAAGHWLADLHRRHAGSGICALTLIRKANGDLEFLLMDRSRSQVHTALGLIHVRPAGEFQPVSENPRQFAEECNLWYVLLRESAEEIGGLNMPRHFVSLREFLACDGIAPMMEVARSGGWRTYHLGFGFDPLNYKPEFLLCSVIEERAFRELFPMFRRDFSEGNGFQGGGEFGLEFTPTVVEGCLKSPRLHPAAAASLSLARKHEGVLRRRG
jgi:hypothetical protein